MIHIQEALAISLNAYYFVKYSYLELKELFDNAKTKEEQDFYMSMANLVLQREQRRVIKEMPV